MAPIDNCSYLLYNDLNKRIRAVHRGRRSPLSGILQDGMLGDKEIAVQIRSNSHYRNSRISGQVGMLIGSLNVEGSWAKGRRTSSGMAGYPCFDVPRGGYFYFILLSVISAKRKDNENEKNHQISSFHSSRYDTRILPCRLRRRS